MGRRRLLLQAFRRRLRGDREDGHRPLTAPPPAGRPVASQLPARYLGPVCRVTPLSRKFPHHLQEHPMKRLIAVLVLAAVFLAAETQPVALAQEKTETTKTKKKTSKSDKKEKKETSKEKKSEKKSKEKKEPAEKKPAKEKKE